MFAPYCPSCRRRMLLGTGRIVNADLHRHREFRVLVRCFCGTVVHHDNPVPSPLTKPAATTTRVA